MPGLVTEKPGAPDPPAVTRDQAAHPDARESGPETARVASRPGAVAFIVDKDGAGMRLDQALARGIPELSRRQARVLIDIGGVFVDGVRAKMAGRVVAEGQRVEANLGGALARATRRVGARARDADESRLPPYRVVFEDWHLVVVDKPAGLLTAATPESDRNNLASLLSRRQSPPAPIFVVHRIDLQTSGLLVFAKTPDANRAMSDLFRVHDITRRYLAVVAGAFPDAVTRIERNIEGRRAVTHLSVRERFGDSATWLDLRLETGRTHQIRIHCRAVRHPVLGDPVLGKPGVPLPPRMALHAAHLGFIHPETGKTMAFDSPWPLDLEPWLQLLRTSTADAP